MPPPPNSNLGYTAAIRLLPDTLLTAFAVGLLATLGAALLPARRVSRTPIIDALRYNI
jgi:putative ABC transport system permease protein